MRVVFRSIYLEKRHPLRIARGVSAGATNLFLLLDDGEHQGCGEMAPGELTGCSTTTEGERILRGFLETIPPDASIHASDARARAQGVPPGAQAARDMAWWDLESTRAGLPLHRMLGLPRRAVATSVTVGINPAAVVRGRIPEMVQRTGARCLKLKLGSPDGVEADQASFLAAVEGLREAGFELAGTCPTAARVPLVAGETRVPPVASPDATWPPPGAIAVRVDANGGWSLADARMMLAWLRRQGADYVEQPLHHDHLEDLEALSRDRPIPIYLDESCRVSADIPPWAHLVDGINVKLMKCGGITEALRLVATARAFGLRTMIGCMGESSIAISAGASLGALFDHIDLDSHLNLLNDPATGPEMEDGIVLPAMRTGHGGRLREEAVPRPEPRAEA